MAKQDWRETLWLVRSSLGPTVTTSRVVAHAEGWRRYEGWRASSIAECLDLCANTHGLLFVDRAELVVDSADYKRQWARDNREKARENSRVQWRKADAIMREQYQHCLQAYQVAFPDAPVPGYDKWRRHFKGRWEADPQGCVEAMHAWKLEAQRGFRLSLLVPALQSRSDKQGVGVGAA